MNLKYFFPVSALKAIARWRYAIACVLMLLILGQAKQVNGADFNPNNSVTNALFTPTAAQRFFEEGVKDFEAEIRLLVRTGESDFTEDILQIKTEFDQSEIPEAIVEPDDFWEEPKPLNESNF